MSAETFLNGRVTLHAGDSRDVLKTIPDCSIDSIVTDPPYALVSIVKRFGKAGSAAVKVPEDGSGAYARASAGFMGKAWDTGETAFATDFWAECLRVLKPGGHVVAFSGTRTYHRMACAIEDAGFEVRDMLSWLYGSGFPKSHDVSKGIDRRGGNSHLTRDIGEALKAAREARAMTAGACDKLFCGGSSNWSWFEGRPRGQRAPTSETFAAIVSAWPEMAPWAEVVAEVEREITGQAAASRLVVNPGHDNDRSATSLDITIPATAAAREWEGWGTALKPACEPICFGRKPMRGTVASNVLEHGTGAINIDGCRVGTDDTRNIKRGGKNDFPNEDDAWTPKSVTVGSECGRWPANIIHDGSGDVLDAFPNEDGTSEARYFYTAKADADDRLGSKHPTVKPVDLMQWLCRLVTPKGGTVLDPFAGTGTTGEAAFREGFNAVLIEREPEYQADIRRRMALVMSGPEERKRESIKAKIGDVPFEPGSLFAGIQGQAAE